MSTVYKNVENHIPRHSVCFPYIYVWPSGQACNVSLSGTVLVEAGKVV